MIFPVQYKNQAHRTLVAMQGRHVLTEHGDEYDVPSWKSLKYALLVGNWSIYVPDLMAFPFLDDAVLDEKAQVYCDKHDNPVSIHVKVGQQKRWITPMSSWGFSCDEVGLGLLRETLRWCNVGDYSTPSGVGIALMGAVWPPSSHKFYVLPPDMWNVFRNTLSGGRSDLIKKDQYHPVLWSLDLNSAYAAAIQLVPAGNVTKHVRPEHWHHGATGYWHIEWEAPPYAPILLPLGVYNAATGEQEYPRHGIHTGWYWTESINRAVQGGVRVREVREGYSFPVLSESFRPWSLHMHHLREHPWPDISGAVKRITVATIGRFAMDAKSRTLTGRPRPGDYPLVDQASGGLDNHYWVRSEEHVRSEHLVHIASYVYDQTRLRLISRAEREGGHLVATNYDEIYTDLRPGEVSSDALGGWKHRPLHNAVLEHKRWIRSDEKTRTPGVPRKSSTF